MSVLRTLAALLLAAVSVGSVCGEESAGLPLGREWAVVNGEIEEGTVDGTAILRWKPTAGQRASLALPPSQPVSAKLRSFDRMAFEFRLVSGRLDALDFQALGHVSGARAGKMHQWHLAFRTTPRGIWLAREVNFQRPEWFPWDKPDGQEALFEFSALAAEPGTIVEFRNLRLTAERLVVKPFFEMPITWPERHDDPDGSVSYAMNVPVLNNSGHPVEITAEVVSRHKQFSVSVEPLSQKAGTGETVSFSVRARMEAAALRETPELFTELLELRFRDAADAVPPSDFTMRVVRPLSPGLRTQFVVSPEDREFLRARFQAKDPAFLKLFQSDKILAEAERFLNVRQEKIPEGHAHPDNRWPVVPGTTPPLRYELGTFMPEIVNPQTGAREAYTPLAGAVWKEYLGYSGRATENLGLAYLLTGEEKYADKAVELFRLYARMYPLLEWRNPGEPSWSNGPAILTASRVARSSTYGTNRYFRWHMLLLAMIADSPSLTPEVRAEIYRGFVLPYATELLKASGGISNMTDMTNHNLLVLGLVFNDAPLVWHAVQSDTGLASRLKDLDAEGFSSEGRPINYHLAAMQEYLPAISYIRNSGLPVNLPTENLLAAVRMPYERANLAGTVPNAGDCGRGIQLGPTALADELVALFPEEDWLLDCGKSSTLAAKIRRLGKGAEPRKSGWENLLDSQPKVFREAGFAILRSGTTAATQIMATLDFGASPMHGHMDRNQFTLSAFGRILSHGPGTLYNAGSGRIIRQEDPRLKAFCGSGSLGQNVILVDGKDQLPASGSLLAWGDRPDHQFVTARVEGIAPGVSHVRTVILREGLVILLDQVDSADEHTYDFVYHNFGTLHLPENWKSSPVEIPLGTTAHFEDLVEPRSLQGTGPLALRWELPGLTGKPAKSGAYSGPIYVALRQIAPPGAQHYSAFTGMNNPNTGETPASTPTLITRVRAKSATFLTLLEPSKDSPVSLSLEGQAGQWQIHRGDETMFLEAKDYGFPILPAGKNSRKGMRSPHEEANEER